MIRCRRLEGGGDCAGGWHVLREAFVLTCSQGQEKLPREGALMEKGQLDRVSQASGLRGLSTVNLGQSSSCKQNGQVRAYMVGSHPWALNQ